MCLRERPGCSPDQPSWSSASSLHTAARPGPPTQQAMSESVSTSAATSSHQALGSPSVAGGCPRFCVLLLREQARQMRLLCKSGPPESSSSPTEGRQLVTMPPSAQDWWGAVPGRGAQEPRRTPAVPVDAAAVHPPEGVPAGAQDARALSCLDLRQPLPYRLLRPQLRSFMHSPSSGPGRSLDPSASGQALAVGRHSVRAPLWDAADQRRTVHLLRRSPCVWGRRGGLTSPAARSGRACGRHQAHP